MLLFQMALAQHGLAPTCQPGPSEPGCLLPASISLPLIVCAFILSLYSFARCVCEVRGSFKHCSKSIALIKGITHNKDKKRKTEAAFRSSVKLEKARYTEQMCCHIANGNTIEKLFHNNKKEHTGKRKERKERYVFTILPACLAYPADDKSYCFFWIGQCSLGLQIPLLGHSGGV